MPAGVIAAVAPGSLGERAGLRAGDELLTINGRRLRDAIDVRYYASDERLVLGVRRGGETLSVEIERRYGEPLGLAFSTPTFDGVHRCNNRCSFCFVAQLPPGLRPSLYVRDDDYRLSFLSGSYITLTNLGEEDWARIGEQRLSPLYVSVHATEPGLRRRMLGNPAAPDVMDQLRRLRKLGIDVHTQIVVVPGVNDGRHLDRSIGDLAELHPAVRSISVVPVGLTRFHRGPCRVHTEPEMRVVLDQVHEWQGRLRERLGLGFAYLADEWYLRLGEEPPAWEAYDGLDLTENGVGLARRFLDGVELERVSGEPRTLVTGTLFAPLLRSRVSGSATEVVPVVNRFFGEMVTVAGLLTGRDVIAALRGRALNETVVLPPAMFGGPQGQTLDGMRPHQVGEALGREIVVGQTGRSLLEATR